MAIDFHCNLFTPECIRANWYETPEMYRLIKWWKMEDRVQGKSVAEFVALMEGRPGFVISPWCGSAECEALIKAETQATIRNIPFIAPSPERRACVKCGQPAVAMPYFAKAY